MSTPERIRAEQEVTRRYSAIMPFWMSSVIASRLPVLALSRGTSGFRPTLAGTACFVGMLASTLTGNVPINKRVLELSPKTDGVRGAARALAPAAHLTRRAERGRAGAPVSGSSAGG